MSKFPRKTFVNSESGYQARGLSGGRRDSSSGDVREVAGELRVAGQRHTGGESLGCAMSPTQCLLL